MKKSSLWCFALFLHIHSLWSQICPLGTPWADDCHNACIDCSFDGFNGITFGYTAGLAPGFCGIADNDRWMGFVAGSDSISIQVTPHNCQKGDGLELALYLDCNIPPLACMAGQAGDGAVTKTLEATLLPGVAYFLMVDGFQGDVCQFSIKTSPPDAVAVLLVDSTGPVQGPAIVSAGSTRVYSVSAVAKAVEYIWSAPSDAKINGQTPPLSLPALTGSQVTVTFGAKSGQVCVRADNPCSLGSSSCLKVTTNTVLPLPCPASSTPAADLCYDACVYCNFNGYTGTTAGYTGQTPPGFCGTIENEQWLGFVAGAPAATFTATPSNCANGNGIQIALYPSCDNIPIQCNAGAAGGGNMPVSITTSLTPGVSYYLMIDGYAGDQCDFQITVAPPSAGLTPPIGPTGAISGPSNVCPGANVAFSVPPVSGAGAYTWSAPPGWLVNGQPTPVTLSGAGGNIAWVTADAQAGPICIQPVNSCNTGDLVCKNVSLQSIPLTQLPPVVVCAEAVPYELPWGDLCFTSGAYETTLISYQGCDSVVRQFVTVKSPIIKTLPPQTVCTGDSVVVCGEVFTTGGGSYTKVCESYQGCDSTINFSIINLEPLANITPGAVSCVLPPVMLNSSPSAGIKLWKDENGQVIGNGNTVTVNDPGIYILEVNTSAGGQICTATDTIIVRFGDIIPAAGAMAGDTLTCVQDSIILDGSTNLTGAVFEWSGPGGFSSSLEDPAVGVPGQYLLVVTDPQSGCSNQALEEVQADVLAPDVQLSSGKLSCATSEVQIVCQVSVSEASFAWSGPDGFTSQEQQPRINQTGIYSVTVTALSNGCMAAAEITVQGDTLPPSVMAAGGVITCASPDVQLTCGTDADVPAFYWLGPAGFTSLQQNPPVNIAGQYDVTVTAANGCTASATALVTEDIQPPMLEVADDSLSCAVPFVLLQCTTSGAQPVFAWGGPGFSSPEQNPVATTAGVYAVTVTDGGNGCTNTAQLTLYQADVLPEVLISLPGELTCDQKTVVLESSTSAAQAVFTWMGPNGFTATSPTVGVEMPGIYLLVVEDSATGCSGAAQVQVTENTTVPNAVITGNEPLNCYVPAVLLSAASSTAGVAFQWLLPGLPPVDGPTLTVDADGLYILTVTDPANGCIGTASALVLQDTVPPVASLRVDTITCRSDSIFIGVANPMDYQFLWEGPNGFSSGQAGFWVPVSALGIYSVTITNPGNGCTQILQLNDFVQNLTPPVLSTVSVVNDQFDQHIGAVNIQIIYPGSVTVTWYKDGALFSNAEDISGLAAGTYTVVVTADDNGCSASLDVEVINITVSTKFVPGDAFWEVFPNPANSRLQLRYKGAGQPEAQVQIMDVTGRVILLQTTAPAPLATLHTNQLPPGIYRLHILTKENSIWKTVVIQR